MWLIKKNPEFDFMGKRKLALFISIVLIVVSIVALATRGLNLGLDFTGGTLVEAGYPHAVELSEVRAVLAEAGFDDAVVQHFGTARDVLVRLAPREGVQAATLAEQVFAVLDASVEGEVDRRRQEFVGPQVGDELTEDGALAMLYALILVMIYVALRFEYRFALGSVAALIHDVIITFGIFALFQLSFDLTVLAAILAVIGYSLNDTIVVFDRIRENFRRLRKGTPAHVMNVSINQTLSRTLVTGVTTLLVLLTLLLIGGELMRNFAIALIIGVVVGTYSSIYVASPVALALGVSKADLMPVKKEGEGEGEGRPEP
ncbi:protein translocase subunit SecF [Ectothiorhodospiraceae bacterium 2226]|nr:protein translocase subunit SecF [Ectothiorhodospiraceae bacterium 2226]